MWVEIVGASLGYNERPVLNDINLAIKSPGIVLVKGPNGSGKTTLLKGIAGLLKPLRGEIRVIGRKPYSILFNRGLIGYVPQDPLHQFSEPRVIDEIMLQALSRNLANYFAEKMGLKKLLYTSPLHLSIGEMKRTLIAAALAKQPKVLLIDEPSLGQDNLSLGSIIDALVEYSEKAVVIVASHDERVARCIDPSIVLSIRGGKVFAE